MTTTPQFADMPSSSNLFDIANFVSKFSYWFKFYVNDKGIDQSPEIVNTSVCVLTNIWRLGRVRDTKFGMNVSNETLLNAVKC